MATAERNIDIVLEPSGEGNVPAAPEVDEGGREVGTVEVHHQLEAEEPGHAAGGIGVAREIAIDLERKEDRSNPAGSPLVQRVVTKDAIDVKSEGVGHHHLLEEPVDDERDALDDGFAFELSSPGKLW